MNDAIIVEGLEKSYGSHVVLKGIDLLVRLGRNLCASWYERSGKIDNT